MPKRCAVDKKPRILGVRVSDHKRDKTIKMRRLSDEIYPNSPLVDVACEIKFAGEMQIECERHKFWDAVRTDYPEILVPGAQPGQAPALQHYRFRSGDQKRAVLITLNSLSYSESEYRGHRKFIKEYITLAKVFGRCYPKVSALTQIGWRYVNFIPFARDSGRIPLERYIKFQLPFPRGLGEATSNIQLRTELPTTDGTLIFQVQNVNKMDQPGFEGLLIDIDYVKKGPSLRLQDVEVHIRHSHTYARRLFEDLITDEYRQYLKGNTL